MAERLTRDLILSLFSVALGVVVGAALGTRAQELDGAIECQAAPSQPPVCGDPRAIAEAEALHEQVPELAVSDLVGASNSLGGISPIRYAISVGELIPTSSPAPARPLPPASAVVAAGGSAPPAAGPGFGPNVDARAWCVEGIESGHGRAMYNPIPVGREHAMGYMGWLPSTAASVGVRIGDRASEWAGFRRMLAAGRGREFYGVSAGIC